MSRRTTDGRKAPAMSDIQTTNTTTGKTDTQAAHRERQRLRWMAGSAELGQLKLDISMGRQWYHDCLNASACGPSRQSGPIKRIVDKTGYRAVEVRACIALYEADMAGLIIARPDCIADRFTAEFAANIRRSDGTFAPAFRGLCERDRWSDRRTGAGLMARAEEMAASNVRQPRLVPDGCLPDTPEHVDADDTDIAGELQIRRDTAVRVGRLDASADMPRRAGGGW